MSEEARRKPRTKTSGPRRRSERVGASAGEARYDRNVGARLAQLVMGTDPMDLRSRARARQAVEALGREDTGTPATQGRLLEARIKALALADAHGSRLEGDLQRLADQARQLDPARVDLRGRGPFVARRDLVERYLERLRHARGEIDTVIATLVDSAEALRQSDVALRGYAADVHAELGRVQADVKVADDFESALVAAVEKDEACGAHPARTRFIRSDVLPFLEERRWDLRNLLALDQQVVLSISMLRETNTFLLQNVNLVARLARQALDGVVTSREGRSEGSIAREQIPAALQASFDELFSALEEHEAWRRSALPGVRKEIDALQTLSSELGHTV